MISNTIKEIAIELSQKQALMVDSLTEQSPLLEIMPQEQTTHGLQHTYEDLASVTYGGFIDIDGEVPDVGIETALKQIDMSVLAGKDTSGIDVVTKMGGQAAYTTKRLPKVLTGTGSKLDREFYYNVYRQAALDFGNSQAFTTAVVTGNTGYSMTVIRFEAGVCTGLYDPDGFGEGKMIATFPIASVENPQWQGTDNNKPVCGYHMRGYLGGMVASPKNVASIVNIDITKVAADTSVPEAIDEMLLQARAEAGNAVIVMHPRLKNKLRAFKGDKLQINVADQAFSRNIDVWEGVPIIADFNLLAGTEALVTL